MRGIKLGTAGYLSKKNKRVMTLQTILKVYEAISALKAGGREYFKPTDEDICLQSSITSMLTVQKVVKLLYEIGILGKDLFAKGHDTSMRLLISRDAETFIRHEYFMQGKVMVMCSDGALVPRAYYYGNGCKTLSVKDQFHNKYLVLNYEASFAGTDRMWRTDFKIEEGEENEQETRD